jgi:NAD(P)H-nitrite reductase large subunit
VVLLVGVKRVFLILMISFSLPLSAKTERVCGLRLDGELEVCMCARKTAAEIIAIIRQDGIRTMEELRERYDISNFCGSCSPDVEALLEQELAASSTAPH